MFDFLNYRRFSIPTIVAIFVILNDYCFCMSSESVNATLDSTFSSAVATWYGSPTGAGSGGACGFADDVANYPYQGYVAAGNNNLFKSGKGCGTCYRVKCYQNRACSGYPIRITITDECPGACNNDAIHFDLSGKAFGSLAKPGKADTLRNTGRINIQYQRVRCYYRVGIRFKIDTGSNPYYLAFAVEYVGGDGDIGLVELLPSNARGRWLGMQQSWGATWKADIPVGTKGPYSVRITTLQSKKTVVARRVIPADWAPGKYYGSRVNFK
ncbi:expansin-B4-like [Sesamum indicum]|uniref:Expansin-B4-like n=1 Tax=Sesamum indicum TaxID=4182 RepID=A0A6I9T4E6_SESIN|nr:expansin-B4-like [Sesamum indicum]